MRVAQKLLGALVFVALVSLVVGNVAAQQTQTFTFDENGNGFFVDGSGNSLTVAGVAAKDPLSGYQAAVYTPPFMFFSGDLVLNDPNGGISDLIRFENDGNIYFLSVLEPGDTNPAMADSVPPADWGQISLQTPVKSFPETALAGGGNGLSYMPVDPDTEPGVAVPIAVQYTIISDVPEPSTFVMLVGFGVASLLSYGWRRWRA